MQMSDHIEESLWSGRFAFPTPTD